MHIINYKLFKIIYFNIKLRKLNKTIFKSDNNIIISKQYFIDKIKSKFVGCQYDLCNSCTSYQNLKKISDNKST